jgi:hypothetical protein
MKKRTGNVWTIVGGKVYGTFDPSFRADMERRATAAGLTFDQYMVRDHKRFLHELLALV